MNNIRGNIMKQRNLLTGLAVPALLLAVSAYAHDPAEHMKDNEGQKLDCTAMKNMDHSKMDMKDPVMQAMMQKCMKQMHGDQTQGEEDYSAHQQPDQDGQQEMSESEHQEHQQHEQ
jgi:ABC-type sugar transport system substrate-binding protein